MCCCRRDSMSSLASETESVTSSEVILGREKEEETGEASTQDGKRLLRVYYPETKNRSRVKEVSWREGRRFGLILSVVWSDPVCSGPAGVYSPQIKSDSVTCLSFITCWSSCSWRFIEIRRVDIIPTNPEFESDFYFESFEKLVTIYQQIYFLFSHKCKT